MYASGKVYKRARGGMRGRGRRCTSARAALISFFGLAGARYRILFFSGFKRASDTVASSSEVP